MKKFFKKFFVFLGAALLLTVSVFGGKLLGDTISASLFDPGKLYNEEALSPDVSAIMARFDAGEITFDVLTEKDAVDALIIAKELLNKRERYKVSATGSVSNSFSPQTITSTTEKNGDLFITCEYAKGFKNVCSKMVLDPITNSIKRYSGVLGTDGKSGDFPESFDFYSISDYKKKYGVVPGGLYPYIISDKTTLSATMQDVAGGKKFIINLNPDKSCFNYAKQLAVNSNMSRPEFKSAQITFVINKDFGFISCNLLDVYVMKVGINVECISSLDAHFDF